MLWVTMRIVYLPLRSQMSSSTASVPSGSRAEQGIGPLKHHPDVLSHLYELHLGAVNVVAEHVDAAGGSDVAQTLVDAIDAA
jgi:hypothetical protein